MHTGPLDSDDQTEMVGAVPHEHSDVDDLRTLRLQVMQLRDELVGSEAKLGEARERATRLEARCRRIEELFELRKAHLDNDLALGKMYEVQVEMMLASTTWRVGRMIVSPPYQLRRLLKGS